MTVAYSGESVFLSSDYDDDEEVFDAVEAAKLSEKTVLYLQRLNVTSGLSASIIELIVGEGRANRGWTKFVVCDCPVNSHLEKMLAVAIQHFSNVVLSDIVLVDGSMMKVTSHGLTLATSPTRLEFREISLDARQMSALSRGISQSSSLETLRFGAVHFKDQRLVSHLAQALRVNRTIRTLQLTRCELLDEQLVLVIDSMIGHPSVNALDLSGNQCRKLSLRSLSNYLSMPDCSLVTLKLGDQFYKTLPTSSKRTRVATDAASDERFPIEELLPGLQANDSIRHLDLSRNQLSDVTAFQVILWCCPHIQTLDLLGNRLASLQALAGRRFMHQTRPSRLRRLELGFNSLWTSQHRKAQKEETAQWLLRLLEDHPELECFSHPVSQSLWKRPRAFETSGEGGWGGKKNGQATPVLPSPVFLWKETSQRRRIQHLLDLNKTGRVLVANNGVPVAIWPMVLERANFLLSDDKVRQANAIFHLLRGPLTMER